MAKHTPIYDERGKQIYAMKSTQEPDPDRPANPWAQMQQEDERFWHGKRIRLSQDWLTVVILLAVGAAVVGAVLLMK